MSRLLEPAPPEILRIVGTHWPLAMTKDFAAPLNSRVFICRRKANGKGKARLDASRKNHPYKSSTTHPPSVHGTQSND